MKSSIKKVLSVTLMLAAALLSACSLNPNVRKQKDVQNGQSYFERGQYQQAAIEFRDAIKTDPRYADAHDRLAETYLRLQQPDRAYGEYAEVLRLRPSDYQARTAMTGLLILGGKYAQAEEQTKILLGERPQDPDVLALVSNLRVAQGDLQGGIAEIQKAIALAPARWPFYLNLALLERRDNEPAAAEATLKKLVALEPHSTEPRIFLGTYYQSQGRFNEAEQQFRNAIATDVRSMEPREALAKLLLVEGKKTEAENVLEKAVADMPNNPESLLDLSNFYFVAGDLNKAAVEYDALYKQHPMDMQIKKKYIQFLIELKRYNEAYDLTNEILSKSPNDSDALVYRSEIEISQGDTIDAIQTLQALIKSAPNESEPYYTLGVAFQKQGNLERAEGEWRQVLRLNPNSMKAEQSIADAAMEQGDMDGLENAANQMIRLQPTAPEGYSLLTLAKINLKQYDEAEKDVQEAIKIAPQSAFGYVQLGNLRLTQQRFHDALQAYQAALDRNGSSIDALRGVANAYIAEGNADTAVAAVNEQILKSPGESSFYELLGALLFRGKVDLNGAEKALEKSVALDQRDLSAWILLCEVRAAQGKIGQAITTDEQALKTNPGQFSLYLLLGHLYESSSDWRNAEHTYQNVLAIDPRNPVASNELARCIWHNGGSLDAALILAQTAREGMPDSPAVYDTMGWIYYQKGAYDSALSCLNEALRLQQSKEMPSDLDIQFHLGMTYEKMNEPALARRYFDGVLKSDPSYGNANQIRQELLRLKS